MSKSRYRRKITRPFLHQFMQLLLVIVCLILFQYCCQSEALWALSLLQPDELAITNCRSLWEIDLDDHENVPAELSYLFTDTGKVRHIWICNQWCGEECRKRFSSGTTTHQHHQCIALDQDSTDTDSESLSNERIASDHTEPTDSLDKHIDEDHLRRMLDTYIPQDQSDISEDSYTSEDSHISEDSHMSEDSYLSEDSDISDISAQTPALPENGDQIMPYVVKQGESLGCCCSPTLTVP